VPRGTGENKMENTKNICEQLEVLKLITLTEILEKNSVYPTPISHYKLGEGTPTTFLDMSTKVRGDSAGEEDKTDIIHHKCVICGDSPCKGYYKDKPYCETCLQQVQNSSQKPINGLGA